MGGLVASRQCCFAAEEEEKSSQDQDGEGAHVPDAVAATPMLGRQTRFMSFFSAASLDASDVLSEDEDNEGLGPLADPEEYLAYHDCQEGREEDWSRATSSRDKERRSRALRRASSFAADALHLRFGTDGGLEQVCQRHLSPAGRHTALQNMQSAVDLSLESVVALAEEAWQQRRARQPPDLEIPSAKEFPELDAWLQPSCALRMLAAARGNVPEAAALLEQAIECQVLDRELLRSRECTPKCNLCVLGKDQHEEPVLFVSMRSVCCSIRELRDQAVLALEAAAEMAGETGRFSIVADMHGFAPSLFMDKKTIANLSARLGSVFCSRTKMVLVVDWSKLFNAAWYLVKPMLKERIRKKLAFVSSREAFEIFEDSFDSDTVDRLKVAFRLARDQASTSEQLISHARLAAIDSCPLGPVPAG